MVIGEYPWVGCNKKSMPIDLTEFKELDAYAQKVNVKDTVENLVSVLLQKAHSDLEKVRAIWVWICHHIEYDAEGCHNRELSLKPADVLRSGKTICAGYALLFAKMCSIAGIQCEYLVGRSKRMKKHAWNAVHLDGKWHLLDCTWGRCRDLGRCNDFYFLTHPALFVEDHFPDDPKWLLLKQTVTCAAAAFIFKIK
ncbi:kyphoscoliosis peptidase-like [Lacerta agilis]|uniref:kyphoscoliosis peptidase-like n=1 Tax=Lacerta agilis TaxID=80427 RepID=UPI0014197D0B|nr:kyphoscoliosis peptidase-like [Lacerta agilis]